MLPHIINPKKGITVIIDGEPRLIPPDDKRYDELLAAFKDYNELEIRRLAVNPIEQAKTLLCQIDGVKVFYGRVELNGELMAGRLVDVILEEARQGLSVTRLTRFLENVEKNPSFRARQDLYAWVEANSMPITTDGCIIAYKIVDHDFMDCYTGTFDNSPGRRVEIARNHVDENPDQTCSQGLHGCGAEYLPSYGPGNKRVVLIKVNPADMVAFPKDYNLSKFRCCGYDVLHEVPKETAAKFFGEHVTLYDGIRLPESFSPLAVVSALMSDKSDLGGAFNWADTPQGHTYWSDIVHEDDDELPDDAKMYLRQLLDQYVGDRDIVIPDDFDPELATELIQGGGGVRIERLFDIFEVDADTSFHFEGLNYQRVECWPEEAQDLVALWLYLSTKENPNAAVH